MNWWQWILALWPVASVLVAVAWARAFGGREDGG